MPKACIIGGGVAGVGLLWTLSQPDQPGQEWDVTLIHDGGELGGHALTVPVPSKDDPKVLVDTGVQFFISLLYPNIEALVNHEGIKDRVPVARYDQLKVACGFPRREGKPQNWGNFESYRGGEQFGMYTEAMYEDAKRFQDFIDVSLILGYAGKTLDEYFNGLSVPYLAQEDFVAYFVDPYLSIINGYGASLGNQVKFEDLFPLFANLPGRYPGLGSFTEPGSGYRRFVNGASSLVQALADQAQQLKTSHVWLDSTVLGVTVPETLPGPIEVSWGSGKAPVVTDSFDKVIFTTDMGATRTFLDTSANSKIWEGLYSKYLSAEQWPLLPGKCYIHTDVEMLSPDLREQEETLQFTAFYAPTDKVPYYEMFKTYTTYIQKNLHPGNPDADGLYLTMYGYIPDESKGDKVPDPDKVIFSEDWTHGMWLPTFMMDAKRGLHMAQGRGATFSYPGQLDTNVYFAGNNTTADSLEHAFISGAVIANYAFGSPYPLDTIEGWAMYELFYKEFMFPAGSPGERRARMHEGR